LDAVRFFVIAVAAKPEPVAGMKRFFWMARTRPVTAVASPWQIKLGGPLPDILISCGTVFSEFIWING
jgi:hypothetical protein